MQNICPSQRGLSRALYLVIYAAVGAIVPFLSIYLKLLGMRADQIGAIIGVRPLVSAIVCPIWGWIADRYRWRRWIALFSVFAWILFVAFLFLCPLIGHIFEASRSHVTNVSSDISDVKDENEASTIRPLSKRHVDTDDRSGKQTNYGDFKDWLKHQTKTGKSLQDILNEAETDVRDTKWPPSEVALTTEKTTVNASTPVGKFESGLSNEGKRFIFIILVTVFGGIQIFMAPTFPLADAVALQSLGPDTHPWGGQRMMGSVGYGMSCALAGLLLTHVVPWFGPDQIGTELKRYLPAFCIAQLFFLMAFVVVTQVRFHMTDLRCHEYKVTLVSKLLASCSYGCYIATALYFGVAMGCTYSFLYWHLHNIGASYIQLGLATLATSLGEAVGFLTATRLITKHGCAAMLVLSLSLCSLRLIIYGYVKEPWLAVPTELLQGTSFSFVWSSSIFAICGSTTPNKALASVTGILHGALSGLGVALGSLLSGILVTNYGAPLTFLYFAFTTISVLLVFLVTHLVIQRPLVQPDFPAEFSISAPDLEKLHDVGDSDDSDDIWAQG